MLYYTEPINEHVVQYVRVVGSCYLNIELNEDNKNYLHH